MKIYDYIIIGGGTAGCVLANRLSANPACRVLLLEAGPLDHDLDFRIHMPTLHSYDQNHSTYQKSFESEPEAHLNNRQLKLNQSKVLGGSSTTNNLVYNRGLPFYFDQWSQNNDLKQWSFNHCLPYFKKLEYRLNGSLNDEMGHAGPLYLTTPSCDHPLYLSFFKAIEEQGYKTYKHLNYLKEEGFAKLEATSYLGKRLSTARAYLHPIMQRKNLTVITEAFTHKLLFRGKKAFGVIYKKGSTLNQALSGQIILSLGALNTPALLQLSGVGDETLLKSLNIPIVHHNPFVGKNLQNQLELTLQWKCRQKGTTWKSLSWFHFPKWFYRWYFHQDGPGTSNHLEAGGYLKTNEKNLFPNLRMYFSPCLLTASGFKERQMAGFQLHLALPHSSSKSYVQIRSNDPYVYPSVSYNYLSTNESKTEWIEAIKLARKIVDSKAFESTKLGELSLGLKVQTDDEIINFISKQGKSGNNPCGTCQMGSEGSSVVDKNLNVHGIEGLSIVDASVMPTSTGADHLASVIMIAEKASDILLKN